MELVPIQVECYSGHKADETPRRLRWKDEWIEVEEVLDCWFQVETLPDWPRADYLKVLDSDQREYLLKHDLESDAWYLAHRWDHRQGRTPTS